MLMYIAWSTNPGKEIKVHVAIHLAHDNSSADELIARAKQLLHRNPQKAFDITCQAEHLHPRSLKVKMFKVNCLIKLRRYELALTVALQNARVNPSPIGLWQIARVYFALGDLDNAEKYVEMNLKK